MDLMKLYEKWDELNKLDEQTAETINEHNECINTLLESLKLSNEEYDKAYDLLNKSEYEEFEKFVKDKIKNLG